MNNKDKFADKHELLKAYNALQAEFTKRCQRLKELERELSEKKTPSEEEPYVAEEKDTDSLCEPIVEETDSLCEEIEDSLCEETEEPLADSDDEEVVGERTEEENSEEENFVEKCGETLRKSEEEKRIVEQPAFAGSARDGYNGEEPQPSDIEERLKARLSDPDFIDREILTNSDITSRIIAAYLASLSGSESVSTLGRTGSMFLSPVKKPKSLAEARALAEKLLK